MCVAGFKFSHDGNEVLRIYVVPGHVSLSVYIGGDRAYVITYTC
jgi:hypothetical protein